MGKRMSCMKKEKRSNRVNIETDGTVYHEKQLKELCALHSLNNLFQDETAFTKESLDAICSELSPGAWFNPHKSIFGLGNYDVNVIMKALKTKGCDIVWFDKRREVSALALENIMGYILNIPTDYKWGFLHLPIHRKHWISIREIKDLYYNLDSKLDAPEIIGKGDELRAYLTEQIQCKDKELLLVVTVDVEKNGTWKKDIANNGNVCKPANENGVQATHEEKKSAQVNNLNVQGSDEFIGMDKKIPASHSTNQV